MNISKRFLVLTALGLVSMSSLSSEAFAADDKKTASTPARRGPATACAVASTPTDSRSSSRGLSAAAAREIEWWQEKLREANARVHEEEKKRTELWSDFLNNRSPAITKQVLKEDAEKGRLAKPTRPAAPPPSDSATPSRPVASRPVAAPPPSEPARAAAAPSYYGAPAASRPATRIAAPSSPDEKAFNAVGTAIKELWPSLTDQDFVAHGRLPGRRDYERGKIGETVPKALGLTPEQITRAFAHFITLAEQNVADSQAATIKAEQMRLDAEAETARVAERARREAEREEARAQAWRAQARASLEYTARQAQLSNTQQSHTHDLDL